MEFAQPLFFHDGKPSYGRKDTAEAAVALGAKVDSHRPLHIAVMPYRAFQLVMIIAMGFFSSLFGCSNGGNGRDRNDRYVTESSFQENLAKQAALSPQTVAQLRKYDVTDDTTLKLEFFFYTDAEAKALALATPLRELNYDVETRPSAGDDELFLVTGWTVPLKMDDRSVVEWTEKMCRLGYEHDCEFDGWGTNPKQ